MNKKLMFLLLISILGFCRLVAHDSAKLSEQLIKAIETNNNALLDETLATISKSAEDVDITEVLNVLAFYGNKKSLLQQSFGSTLPIALGCFGGYLGWKVVTNYIQAAVFGCGFIWEGKGPFPGLSDTNVKWFISDKNGNRKIVTRTEYRYCCNFDTVKSSALMAGSFWAVLGLGTYLYQRQHYKHLVEKILRTPHVIFDKDKLTTL